MRLTACCPSPPTTYLQLKPRTSAERTSPPRATYNPTTTPRRDLISQTYDLRPQSYLQSYDNTYDPIPPGARERFTILRTNYIPPSPPTTPRHGCISQTYSPTIPPQTYKLQHPTHTYQTPSFRTPTYYYPTPLIPPPCTYYLSLYPSSSGLGGETYSQTHL